MSIAKEIAQVYNNNLKIKLKEKLEAQGLEVIIGDDFLLEFEKELIRAINDYGDLQWRLANAHREMFNSK